MKDKWRRMSTRELRAAMVEARQAMEKASYGLGPSASIAHREAETSADDIAAELSRREITHYTAVAAVAGALAAIGAWIAVFFK